MGDSLSQPEKMQLSLQTRRGWISFFLKLIKMKTIKSFRWRKNLPSNEIFFIDESKKLHIHRLRIVCSYNWAPMVSVKFTTNKHVLTCYCKSITCFMWKVLYLFFSLWLQVKRVRKLGVNFLQDHMQWNVNYVQYHTGNPLSYWRKLRTRRWQEKNIQV